LVILAGSNIVAILTDTWENQTLDFLFRGQAMSPPTSQWIALFTSTGPTDAGTANEVTGVNYTRQQVTSNTSGWAATSTTAGGAGSGSASAGTDGTIRNQNAITFNAAGAGGWGTVTYVGAFSASSSGTLLWYAPLTTSKLIQQGDVASFAAGTLTIQID
jgi:hypothetical protein